MALWLTDGCTKTNVVSQVWPINTGTSYQAGKGRFGTPALNVTGSTGPVAGYPITSNPATFFTGFAWQTNTLPSTGFNIIWSAYDSVASGRQVFFAQEASGQLSFYLSTGNTKLVTTSASYLPNVINYLEIKTTIDPTAGLVEARLNGQTTPILTYTGNTRSTSNSFLNQIRFECSLPQFSSNWFSDMILFDSVGAAPNAYLGNKRVYTSLAKADSASAGLNTWSTSPSRTAGNHYLNIIETPPDGDTTYNFTSTATARESYQFASLPANAGVVSVVNAWSYMRVDDAQPHTAQITARSNSVDAFGATLNPGASYNYFQQAFPVDPNTGIAWTPTGFNSAEFGVELLT